MENMQNMQIIYVSFLPKKSFPFPNISSFSFSVFFLHKKRSPNIFFLFLLHYYSPPQKIVFSFSLSSTKIYFPSTNISPFFFLLPFSGIQNTIAPYILFFPISTINSQTQLVQFCISWASFGFIVPLAMFSFYLFETILGPVFVETKGLLFFFFLCFLRFSLVYCQLRWMAQRSFAKKS